MNDPEPNYAILTDKELLQIEWSGSRARFFRRDLLRMRSPPAALVAKQEEIMRKGEAADRELDKRGIHERYC